MHAMAASKAGTNGRKGEVMASIEHGVGANASSETHCAGVRHRKARKWRALLCAGACWIATCASAQDGQRVHRCVGRNGEIVFSGLPCNEDASATGSVGSATQSAPPADACPTSAADLRERIAGAIARRDANAIAGAMRWRGVRGREANARLAQLRALVREPLLSIDDTGSGFEVKTGSNLDVGVRSATFGVDSEGGCFWLTW